MAELDKVAERIGMLAENPLLGREPYQDPLLGKYYSNCLGTALWVHGLTDFERPCFLQGFKFDPELFEQTKRPGSIFFYTWPKSESEDPLFTRDENYHAGIWIERKKRREWVFDQKGWGGNHLHKTPCNLSKDEGLFGFGNYDLSGEDVSYHYPREGKEEEIKKGVRQTMLAYNGMTPEKLRAVQKLEPSLEEIETFMQRDPAMTRMIYGLYQDLMEAKGQELLSPEEFGRRWLRMYAAQEHGAVTAFAGRTFITKDTDAEFLAKIK